MIVNNDDLRTVDEALDGLMRCHHGELVRILAARVHNPQDVAELEQEVYARLLRYPGRYSPDDFRRLIFRIAGNLLTDHWRWRRHREADITLGTDHLTVPDGAPGPERVILSQQQMAHLEALVYAMPSQRRRVFVLSRMKGYTNAEVALRCHLSEKTVEKHLARALKDCRQALGAVGPSSFRSLYEMP